MVSQHGWWRRSGRLALGAAAVVTIGGCQYFFGYPPDPSFTEPTPVQAYHSGRATITIGSDPAIVLGELARPGVYDSGFGSSASFHNDKGWYVQVMGASAASGFLGQTAYLQLDRIVDGQHWTTWDPSRCIVTVQKVDETVMRGTASCKGLRWSDALGASIGSLEPPYIEGQDPFDAEITFEATKSSTQTS